MSEPAIRVEKLGKRYRLKHETPERYTALRDVMSSRFRQMFKPRKPGASTEEDFWALRDVEFDVQPGEVLGIIGHNGAGKSTLLKIVSRITEPTVGRITLEGRVASLLEVGTGFHPELTGRENVFLNGAILGMTRAEIVKKFDEIVAFAEIEKFLDTPVKRYSSGMYVRLAFAVAAHLEPEILIVDEVLAVGDAQFQRKCLGKMQDVARDQGRTVLFVSHNLQAVTRLCQRALLLDQGRLLMDGAASTVVTHYLNARLSTTAERSWPHLQEAPGDTVARLKSVRVLQAGRVSEVIDIRQPVTLEMEYWSLQAGSRLMVAANFFNDDSVLLFLTADLQETRWHEPRAAGVYVSKCEVPGNFFAEGMIRVMAEVCTREPVWVSHVREADVVSFNVVDSGEPGSVRSGWSRPFAGVVRPMLPWHTEVVSDAAALPG